MEEAAVFPWQSGTLHSCELKEAFSSNPDPLTNTLLLSKRNIRDALQCASIRAVLHKLHLLSNRTVWSQLISSMAYQLNPTFEWEEPEVKWLKVSFYPCEK